MSKEVEPRFEFIIDHEDKSRPGCHAGRDGECWWERCPQIRDGEPDKTGRHCPRDKRTVDDFIGQ